MKIKEQVLNIKRDIDGRAIINLHVNDDSSFLSTYSEEDKPIISEEVATFLENSSQAIPHKESLTLKINSNCIDEQEQQIYKNAIKNYYTNHLVSTKRELEKSFFIALILAVIGIIILTIAQIVGYHFESIIWAEVIDIAAWVFLWEAVDIFVFRTRTLQLNKKRYSAFIDMKIEYFSITNTTNLATA